MQLLIVSALSLLSLNVWGLTIYKCKSQLGGFRYQRSPCEANAEVVTSWAAPDKKPEPPPEPKAENKSKIEFIIKQNNNGAYLIAGSINDKALTFIIDTGASFVSLPSSFAHEAGIYCQESVDMKMQTANGAVESCQTTIKKLNFGPFYMNDVSAIIVENLSQPLLGMNVLQQLKMAQDRGEMRLSTRD